MKNNDERKHVLVLMCDQMRADKLGIVDPLASTPHLDALANDGVHCTNTFSNHPQCSPARACVMSGQYSHEVGVLTLKNFSGHQSIIPAEQHTLAKTFRAAGYRTVYFGKCHLNRSLEELGFEEGLITDKMSVSDEEATQRGFPYVPAALRSDYIAYQSCMEFLNKFEDDGRPLFLYFSTNLPHPPFFTCPDHIDKFPVDTLQLPNSRSEDFSSKPDFVKEHSESRHGAFDEAAVKQELAQYYSMMSEMDQQFGDIMDQFKQHNLWDETVVSLFADHGDMMGGHNLRLKGTLPYDDILQIPNIWRFPNNAHAGSTCDKLLDQVHIPATLMQAAGIDIPNEFRHGGQLAHITDQAQSDTYVYFEHYAAYWGLHPFIGLRSKDWKFIRYYGEEQGFCELYDLQDDPMELHNIADAAEQVSRVAEFHALLDAWWQDTNGKDFAFYESDTFKSGRWNEERLVATVPSN